MDAEYFLTIAAPIVGRRINITSYTARQQFKRKFCMSAEVAAAAWELMQEHDLVNHDIRPEHLLWAGLFLKHYQTEEMLADHLGKSVPTVQRYLMPTVIGLMRLSDIVVSCDC